MPKLLERYTFPWVKGVTRSLKANPSITRGTPATKTRMKESHRQRMGQKEKDKHAALVFLLNASLTSRLLSLLAPPRVKWSVCILLWKEGDHEREPRADTDPAEPKG